MHFIHKPVKAFPAFLLLVLGFSLMPVSSVAQETGDTGEQKKPDYEKLFQDATAEERIVMVKELEAAPENEILVKKLVEFIFSEKDYSNSSVPLELYAAASGKMLEFMINRPGSAALFGFEKISASISFLSSYGYADAYPLLYRLRSVRFPAEYDIFIRDSIRDALAEYNSPRYGNVLSVIRNNPVGDVHSILLEVEKDTFLSPAGKGSLFEAGLDYAMNFMPQNHVQSSLKASIQQLCVKNISFLRWSEAAPQVIIYFDQLLGYRDISVVKRQLIDTIDCLGNLMTAEAIERLNVYLELTNRYAEKGLDYDRETVAAVIENLGKAGDIRSYGNLSNAAKAPYPEDIVKMAETALSRIKIIKE